MNQLAQIRIEKHKEYLRQTWLPEFFEKYKPYFDKENKAKKNIYKFIKTYALPNVINEDHLQYIPGIFRVRLKITDDNLFKPIIEKKENSDEEEIKDPLDADLDQVINESLKEYNQSYEQALNESIKDNHDVDYEEYILNQAIMESLNNNPDIKIENHQIKKQKYDPFYYVIDIREYIKDLTQPINIYGDTYYFSAKQSEYLQKLWHKLNPETDAGIQFHQNFAYYKTIYNDKKV